MKRKRESNKEIRERQIRGWRRRALEAEEDAIFQRMLMEKMHRTIKECKDIDPGLYKSLMPYIEEYEQRFTLIGANEKASHPVFRDK